MDSTLETIFIGVGFVIILVLLIRHSIRINKDIKELDIQLLELRKMSEKTGLNKVGSDSAVEKTEALPLTEPNSVIKNKRP